jgi:hypothetical protein
MQSSLGVGFFVKVTVCSAVYAIFIISMGRTILLTEASAAGATKADGNKAAEGVQQKQGAFPQVSFNPLRILLSAVASLG